MALDSKIKRISIVKSWAGSGGGTLTSTYDFSGDAPLSDDSWRLTAQSIALAEAKCAGDKVFFQHARVQFWNGKNAQGVKVKPRNVDLGFYGHLLLDDIKSGDGVIWLPTDYSKVLPPEIVVAVNFSGGEAGLGTHTYRHSIAGSDWFGDGGKVQVKQVLIDRVNNAFQTYLEQSNATNPLVLISGKGAAAVAYPVSAIKYAAIRNRQLEVHRTGKKGEATVDKMTPEELAQEIDNAQSLLSQVEALRHTDKGNSIFTTQSFIAGLAALTGIAALVKQAKDAGDYGPNLVQ